MSTNCWFSLTFEISQFISTCEFGLLLEFRTKIPKLNFPRHSLNTCFLQFTTHTRKYNFQTLYRHIKKIPKLLSVIICNSMCLKNDTEMEKINFTFLEKLENSSVVAIFVRNFRGFGYLFCADFDWEKLWFESIGRWEVSAVWD